VIEKIGGRGGIRTRAPACKQIVKNLKCLFWCRYDHSDALLIRTMDT